MTLSRLWRGLALKRQRNPERPYFAMSILECDKRCIYTMALILHLFDLLTLKSTMLGRLMQP